MKIERVCLLILAALLLAVPCSAQKRASGGSGPNNQPAAEKIKPPQVSQKASNTAKRRNGGAESNFVARERELWDTIRRKDTNTFASFLAEDQLYVTGDGMHSKAETVQIVSTLTLSELNMTDFKVTMVDKDAALVTYRATGKGTFKGQPASFDEHDSTLWVKRGNQWLAVFHQDTQIQPGQ